MLFISHTANDRLVEASLDGGSVPGILKTRDLAILLDLSPDVVNDMARRGHLRGFKSGNQWRFRRRDVERYIDRMKKLAPPG
jgi:excisionase family DNA binding protein